MPKKFFVAALGLFLVLGLLHLGMKVHDLEHRIDTLEHGGGPEWPERQSAPKVRIDTLNSGGRAETEAGPAAPPRGVQIIHANYFVDPAGNIRKDSGRSEVGVPWEIERGMMFDVQERAKQMQFKGDGNGTVLKLAPSSEDVLQVQPSQTIEIPRELLQNLPGPR